MDHDFCRSGFALGIEEELMIVADGSFELVSAVESLLEEVPVGAIKPELMESVLEISTEPCHTVAEAAVQLRALRRQVCGRAGERALRIGSAGTHPFAMWEEQRIVSRERYRGLVASLGFVARQELIFGMHVHVGVDDPDKAIYVANGMRVHIPILVALSANSPFWRGEPTGLMASRTPIFRAFPRVGVPPAYTDWADYERRIDFMVSSGVIEDYTYLWYDVRPHPLLGTVEIRAMDSQTRLEHTLALGALTQCLVKELADLYEAGRAPTAPAWEMLDENKWLAARHGLDVELVDLPSAQRVGACHLARRLLERLGGHAQDLDCERELEGIGDLIEHGTGAARQMRVYDANHDLREVMSEIVTATGA